LSPVNNNILLLENQSNLVTLKKKPIYKNYARKWITTIKDGDGYAPT
jgi:hypothetical protein